jgi:integrase
MVSAMRMKAGREHRVPLSGRTIAILERVALIQGEFVFPGQRGDHLTAMPRLKGFTVHGFRSSFRDWAGNETNVPREICEAALAHAVGSQVERAYRRGDALEKRRALMAAWEAFCGAGASGSAEHIEATEACCGPSTSLSY